MLKKVLASLVFCAVALAQATDNLVGGPFVVNVTPRSATVVWIAQSSQARLGPSLDKLLRVSPALRAEKVSFAGLDPGKTHHYDVLGSEEGKGYFKTPPAEAAPFHFVAYGDTRTRHDVHRTVVEGISKVEPDFLLHTGDLVADGIDTAQWPVFFSISKELFRKTVFFPSLGNHERNSRHYYDFFDADKSYYSFNWGNAHFTVLNTDVGNIAPGRLAREAFWKEQLKWLEEDLAMHQKADFRFVAMHHPPFTAVKRRQGGNEYLMSLLPIFEKYKVAVVFTGHDHNYQHHLKDGVRYVITGGGGAPLYPTDAPIPGLTVAAESVENFVHVKVDGKQALLQALTPDGRTIDQIKLGTDAPFPK